MSGILTEALNLLDFWGAHPLKRLGCRSFTRLVLCVGVCVYGLYKMVQYTLVNWTNVTTLAANADGFPTVYQALWKLIFMFYYRKDLIKALEMIEAFSISNLKPGTDLTILVEEMHRKSNMLYKVFRCVITFGGSFYAMRPLFSSDRELPAPLNFSCDVAVPSCYIFWYSLEIIGITFTITFTLAGECLFFAFISTVYIELEAIKYCFKNLDFGGETEMEFGLLVEHHDLALKFIALLNKMYGMVLFQQCACQVATICFLVFDLNSERLTLQLLLKTVPVLMSYHGELFVMCFAGNLLTIQAADVADALYECNWYENLHRRFVKDITIVMGRAQRPVKLTILGIWDLGNAMFVKVVKTSVSVMALVQTFYDFSVE